MFKRAFFFFLFLFGIFNTNTYAASESTAPDSTQSGPYKVSSAEYKFPAAVDPEILSDRKTEIWGKLFYPSNQIPDKSPLVVMLHGNHATCGEGSNPRIDNSCEYTEYGACPKGSVVTPNHEGYDYLAKNLASWGFLVVSINANRGITCGGGAEADWGLNLARGRLILKHLNWLYQWSTIGDAPASLGLGSRGLIGKIDFNSVGLLGHSRGGEGARAAYNLYADKNSEWPQKIPGLVIKAIFEIGAVDGQTGQVLDANGTAWNQLLPMCDGDVSDLEGAYPFERMMLNKSEKADAQKSLYEVWGANHNFFNTEWQESDSYGCDKGSRLIFDPQGWYSLEQQQIALASVPAFFRSRLGAKLDPTFNQNFNPLKTLPATVTKVTQVDRDFTPSPGASENKIVDDFEQETGVNSSGYKNQSSQIDITHLTLLHNGFSNDTLIQRAAQIKWTQSSPSTFFEAVWAADAEGIDIRDYVTLDFRIGRVQSAKEATNFSIALEDAKGLLSKEIQIKHYANINGPGNANPILMTVRIPLSAFEGIDLTKIHGVRFIFNKTKKGALYLANIRMQRQWGWGMDKVVSIPFTPITMPLAEVKQPIIIVPKEKNVIRSVRRLNKTLALTQAKPGVEITVASEVPFPVMNRLPILKIGDKKFKLSRYSDVKHLKELTFTLTEKEYQHVSKEAEVSVENGKVWQFAPLAK
jgi:hypothetical protein